MALLEQEGLKRRLAEAEERSSVSRSFAQDLMERTRRIQEEAQAVHRDISALRRRQTPAGKAAELWERVKQEAEPLLAEKPAPFHGVLVRVASLNQSEYGLRAEDTNDALREDLENFYAWMTQPSFDGGDRVVRPVTAGNYMSEVRLALGWLLYIRLPRGDLDHLLGDGSGDPAPGARQLSDRRRAGLQLRTFLPTADAEGAALAYELLQWIRHARERSPSSQAQWMVAIIKLAKYVYRSEAASSTLFGQGSAKRGKGFEQLGLIRQLRELNSDLLAQARTASSPIDVRKKQVSWPTFLMCVKRLHEEYRSTTEAYARRRPQTVAKRLQLLIAFAILSVFPDRQRTLRELEIGRTLVQVKGGIWVIRQTAADFKTGATFGERAQVALPRSISKLISTFVRKWRRHLNPARHNFLFVRPGTGAPFQTPPGFGRAFGSAMYQLTGKKTTPHVLRDAVVTFMRNLPDVDDEMLESLALLMGHSVDTQRSVYDKSTAMQKVSPALTMMWSTMEQYASEAQLEA